MICLPKQKVVLPVDECRRAYRRISLGCVVGMSQAPVVVDYSVVWTDLLNATAVGGTITRGAAADGWGAGGCSVASLAGNGYLEFKRGPLQQDEIIGLSHANPSHDFHAITYGIYLYSGGNYFVFEAGVNKFTGGAFSETDVFRISKTGTTIIYLFNGTPVYTSLTASSTSLLAGVDQYYHGISIVDAKLVPA